MTVRVGEVGVDMDVAQVTSGRRFFIRLPRGKDLISCLEMFCSDRNIRMATFAARGSVSGYTLGTYDPVQQVYVTHQEDSPREMVACSGSVGVAKERPWVCAHVVLADDAGKVEGGRLFSETIVFAAEIDLQEVEGNPLQRTYDPDTGLGLWS